MKTLETRIVNIEDRISPAPEEPCIVFVVHETDSALEHDTIKEKAIADYEQKYGVEVDPQNASFLCIVVYGGSKG